MADELNNAPGPEDLASGAAPAPAPEPLDAMAADAAADAAAYATEPVAAAASEATQVVESAPAAVADAAEQVTEVVEPVGASAAETVTMPAPAPVQPTAEMPTPYQEPQPTTRIGIPETAPQGAFDAQPQAVYQAEAPGSYAQAAAVGYAATSQAQAAQAQPQPAPAGHEARSPYFAPPAPPAPTAAYQASSHVSPTNFDIQSQPVAPLAALTGGMKFGWLVVGMFLSIPGMLIAWLTNADKHPQVKKDAIMWSVIGFAINVVLGILITIIFTGMLAAIVSSGGYYGYY